MTVFMIKSFIFFFLKKFHHASTIEIVMLLISPKTLNIRLLVSNMCVYCLSSELEGSDCSKCGQLKNTKKRWQKLTKQPKKSPSAIQSHNTIAPLACFCCRTQKNRVLEASLDSTQTAKFHEIKPASGNDICRKFACFCSC